MDNELEIEHLADNYFETLFTTSDPQDLDSALREVPMLITEEMNNSLTKVISPEEVKRALFSVNLDKASGPDGMTTFFYQHYWDLT